MADKYLEKYKETVKKLKRPWPRNCTGMMYDPILGPCFYMSRTRPSGDSCESFRSKRDILNYING